LPLASSGLQLADEVPKAFISTGADLAALDRLLNRAARLGRVLTVIESTPAQQRLKLREQQLEIIAVGFEEVELP
jgi:hypothetical protein